MDAKEARDALNALRARVMDLEDAVGQSQNTITFMHGCLMDLINEYTGNGRHRYAYPEHTTRFLEELSQLYSVPTGCGHSFRKETCESCAAYMARRALRKSLGPCEHVWVDAYAWDAGEKLCRKCYEVK